MRPLTGVDGVNTHPDHRGEKGKGLKGAKRHGGTARRPQLSAFLLRLLALSALHNSGGAGRVGRVTGTCEERGERREE